MLIIVVTVSNSFCKIMLSIVSDTAEIPLQLSVSKWLHENLAPSVVSFWRLCKTLISSLCSTFKKTMQPTVTERLVVRHATERNNLHQPYLDARRGS